MLEQTRRQASVFIYLVFGLLIVIFILGINPGNKSGREGCGVSTSTVVAVDGVEANQSAYHIAYGANGGQGRQKVYLALDQIIRRELLAQAADERGIRTGKGDDTPIQAAVVKEGDFFLGGQRIDFKRQLFQPSDGGARTHFSRQLFKAWANSLNVSESSYLDEQARGLQAALMGELVTSSVRVSRDEALAEYLYDNNTVTYDVVAFDPAKYRRAMKLTDADVKRFLEDHGAEVQARYKADERTYKGLKPQLAIREIFIPKAVPEAGKPNDGTDKAAKPDDKAAKPDDKAAKPDDKAAKPDDKAAKPGDKAAKADDKAAKPGDKAAKTSDKTGKAGDKAANVADKKPAAGDAPKPFGLPTDVAKAKLETVRAEILAGKLTFPDAEKQLAADSSDDAPAENGDRGWLTADTLSLGEKAISDAAKTLKPGEMTPVVVTDRGAYLVIATAKREGDLSFDQVKNELARELAKDVWSKEAAKRAALEALAQARATAGKNLDQMFEREPVKPGGGGIQEILSDPNIPQEEKQKILEQLLRQQKHGSLEVHEQDVPVAWYAEADGSGQGSAATAGAPAPGSAAPPPAAG
ncbi:MAG TPA: peptidylprolyl isomerase, partial [Kofleriaceae bacterium]